MLAPKEWTDCPKKSYLIGKKFVAFKTPLDQKFEKKLKKGDHFTPDDVFDWIAKSKLKLGLWIDLTKTYRYFDGARIQERGCQYEKIMCEGHGSAPTFQQVKVFTNIIDKFIAENPDKIVAVHCTHGYNRTGYLIVSYLVTRMKFRVDDAIKAFSKGRPPGIYREPYVRELVRLYGGDMSKHFVVTPFWVKKGLDKNAVPEQNDIARVHMPPEQQPVVRNQSRHGTIPCILPSRVPESRPQLSDQTYIDEKRRKASKRKWKNFDDKRREKRRREKDDSRKQEDHVPRHRHRDARNHGEQLPHHTHPDFRSHEEQFPHPRYPDSRIHKEKVPRRRHRDSRSSSYQNPSSYYCPRS